MNVLERDVLALPDDKSDIFYSTKAVSWSHDNKAVLCCAEKLLIIGMVTNSHSSHKSEAFMTTVEETLNVTTLDRFSVATDLINLKDTLTYLNEGERQMLLTDPSLTENFIFPNEMLSCFKQAVCSPVNHFERPQTLIAAVTFDHRVLVFVNSTGDWKIAADCATALREHTIRGQKWPLVLGKDMSFSAYRDLVLSMCIVELEWSAVFTCNKETERSGQLLFTGTRGGQIHTWKASLPFESREDLTIQCTDQYPSEVLAISWLSAGENKGLLSVGYKDGTVRVVEYMVSAGSAFAVAAREVFRTEEADSLAVSDLSWLSCDQGMVAFVACKQYYLSLYTLCGDSVQFIGHTLLDVDLPLSSISTFGACGVVSSPEGSIFGFQCQNQSDQVSLEVAKVIMSHATDSAGSQWLCQGVAVSPTSGICLSAHRINNNYKLPDIRSKFMSRQRIILSSPFKLATQALLTANAQQGQPFSPQHAMLNLRLHIQQLCLSGSSLQNLLQIFQDMSTRSNIHSIQIARDILLYLQQWTAIRTQYQQELDWISHKFEEMSKKLLVQHIESSLSSISTSPSASELLIMKSMLSWISAKQCQSSLSNQLDLDSLKRACQQAVVPSCAICGSDLHVVGLLLAQCVKKHQIKLCSLTLLPCQEKSVRKCESCQHQAVSLSFLSDVTMIKVQSLCTICGGFLRDLIT